MARGFQRLHHVPCLTFHHCDLSGKHTLLEVGVLRKDFAKRDLSLAPPVLRGEEGEEMLTSALGEGSANQ